MTKWGRKCARLLLVGELAPRGTAKEEKIEKQYECQ